MDFAFTPEQIQLRNMVRDFATAEIGPHVSEWDENQTFPLEAVKQAGQLGLLGTIFPEDLGGAGLTYVDYSLIIEELARVDPSFALIAAAHNSLCTNHIFIAGDEEQKAKYMSSTSMSPSNDSSPPMPRTIFSTPVLIESAESSALTAMTRV